MGNDFIFPKWTNRIPKFLITLGVLGFVGVVSAFYFLAAPDFIESGYEPAQPNPFSHKVHAGNLGLDCRYCHSNVERSSVAGVPATETCMNCHRFVRWDTPTIRQVTGQWSANVPFQWTRVHRLPDFAYFSHQPHVRAGLECAACHGDVASMDRMRVVAPMSMGWCLNCHRNLDKQKVTKQFTSTVSWESPRAVGHKVIWSGTRTQLNPPKVDCSGCHR